ncbi:MAG: hypothetical protein ACFFDW_13955 [Candidatus Thorarchaeota archaeon]
MSSIQKKILAAVKDNIETIESQRYNSEDPIINVNKNDSHEEVTIKILTSERTGAPLKMNGELINTAEKLAEENFASGVRALNSWQFKKCSNHLDDAANITRDPRLQQRINLYKQLHKILQATIRTSPERILKSQGNYFEELISLIPQYDKFELSEQNHYRKIVDSMYGLIVSLSEGDKKLLSEQLYARCTISLFNHEYLAAYIWIYKIYLINKDEFDKLAAKDEILHKALESLRKYLEIETGLTNQIEDSPTIASAYDLQTIFTDHLTSIFDVDFDADTKENYSFPAYREND